MVKGIFILAFLCLASGLGILIVIGLGKTHAHQPQEQIATPTPTPIPSQNPSYLEAPPATPDPSIQDPELLVVLHKKYGEKTNVVIEDLDGNYAQGTVRTPGKEDKWWLAVKKNDIWEIVLDGYSYVYCRDIAKYKVPTTVVPTCWGKGGVVDR